eukprot:scaffold5.g983.t1
MADGGPQPSGLSGAAAPSPAATARTASRGAPSPGGGASYLTPGSRSLASSQQLRVPGTGLRGAVVNGTQPTPLTRPELGLYQGNQYVGFRQPAASPRRSSLAPSESVLLSEDMDTEADQTYIWGTNLSVSRVQARFSAFIRTFREQPGDPEPKYLRLLQETRERGEVSFNIDGRHMHAFDRVLYNWAVTYPAETVPIFDGQLSAIAGELEGREPEQCQIQSRIFNLTDTKVIRDLNPSDINKLIAVSGMVTRTSSVIPDQSLALFRCTQCGEEQVEWNDRGKVNEPSKCPNPSCQENPNDIPEGETPHTVSMFARQDLVDLSKPGDRITKDEAANLFSLVADESQTQGTQGTQDVVRPTAVQNTGNLTREDLEAKKEMFHAIASDPDVYDNLTASLAPSIWQLDDVKRGILCQLFGGVSKKLPGAKTRGEINCLLVGDPGVSKSQLLGYVHKLAPRGIYTSGKGSSAVGLTAYVTKDSETKEMVLESGALVLSDRGVCCIDEFDKMSEAARSMLHEVMEQQTISVAKAGIIATLNARTSGKCRGLAARPHQRWLLLASANPLSVVDNIQLPPSLLSRFDLIYLASPWVPLPSNPKLVHYADRRLASCHPELSHEAAEKLKSSYIEMRAMGMSRKTVSATPRQLESLIRLSEALARMRLSTTVSADDVNEAVRLMKVAMQQSSIDPRTGQIDMDVIQTGVSAADRTMKAQLAGELRALLEQRAGGPGGSVRLADVLDAINAQASVRVSKRDVRLALAELEDFARLSNGVVQLRA